MSCFAYSQCACICNDVQYMYMYIYMTCVILAAYMYMYVHAHAPLPGRVHVCVLFFCSFIIFALTITLHTCTSLLVRVHVPACMYDLCIIFFLHFTNALRWNATDTCNFILVYGSVCDLYKCMHDF